MTLTCRLYMCAVTQPTIAENATNSTNLFGSTSFLTSCVLSECSQFRVRSSSLRCVQYRGSPGSGITFPSVLTSVYFLAFLGVGTWWACYKSFGRKFAVLRIALLLYSGANLILLYLYQFQFFQAALQPQDFYAR